MTARGPHLPASLLLDYWLQDTDPAATDAVEVHLMECDDCGARLDALVALGSAVRDATRAGTVGAVVADAFARRLRADAGLRVREYRLPHNGSVHCTLAPDDDLLLTRVQVPLAGIRRLDAVTETSLAPGARHTLLDVPFDAAAGELVYLLRTDVIRSLPDHTLRLTLVADEPQGRRELGQYVFHHGAWPGRSSADAG